MFPIDAIRWKMWLSHFPNQNKIWFYHLGPTDRPLLPSNFLYSGACPLPTRFRHSLFLKQKRLVFHSDLFTGMFSLPGMFFPNITFLLLHHSILCSKKSSLTTNLCTTASSFYLSLLLSFILLRASFETLSLTCSSVNLPCVIFLPLEGKLHLADHHLPSS